MESICYPCCNPVLSLKAPLRTPAYGKVRKKVHGHQHIVRLPSAVRGPSPSLPGLLKSFTVLACACRQLSLTSQSFLKQAKIVRNNSQSTAMRTVHVELRPPGGGGVLFTARRGQRPAGAEKPRKKAKLRVPKAKPHKVKGSALTQGRGCWRGGTPHLKTGCTGFLPKASSYISTFGLWKACSHRKQVINDHYILSPA